VPLSFQIQATSGTARQGGLITPHAVIETPVFMPVGTIANVKAVPHWNLEELGAQIILGNTYHLFLRPGAQKVRAQGGLHRFMSWKRALLTDSGGFQVFSLSPLRKLKEEGVEFRSHLDGALHFLSPETATEAQIALGADIIMAFDECTEYPAERGRARESMELTLRWAARCKRYFEEHKDQVPWEIGSSCQRRIGSSEKIGNGEQGTGNRTTADSREPTADSPRPATQSLFGIVQGGMHKDLRRECAERLVEMDFPGYAIGGLSVGEPRELTYEIVAEALQYLPKDKPRYLMGVGTPEEIVQYARMGVDMMDCVHPTRAARHGLLFTSEGKVNIKNSRYADDQRPLDEQCGCPVCQRFTRAYLRHLFASGELLAQVLNSIHNLSHYLDTMKAVRHSITSGECTSSVSGDGSVAGR
jgi:queuine tRNA-ribosyltransferase